MYARFAWGFPAYLRLRITPEAAKAELSTRLAERERNFLHLVERGVFGYSRSPYRKLFDLAGCTLGDLRQMVRSHGLEKTLLGLREAGVYVGYEEFKGRRPIVRGGLEIPVRARDFDNPFLSAAYQRKTSGTTGPGTRVMIDVENLRARSVGQLLAEEAYGSRTLPLGLWQNVLPGAGLVTILTRIPYAAAPRRWFTPVDRRRLRSSLEFRLANEYVLRMSRLCGVPFPRPEPVPLDRAGLIARWVADTVQKEGGCVLRTGVSKLLRISVAAQEEGIDLTGALLWGAGEPPTPAKVDQIRRCGGRYVSHYAVSEFGRVGYGCVRPVEVNDNHFCQDHLAAIQWPQAVPGTDLEVDAFHFTTLLPSAPKLAVNVQSDDYGILEERDCGCPLQELGLTRHVRNIRSFRKMTGESMTLVGSDMLRILEEELPARFGGSANDYQLAEEEDERGFTRVTLLVSPRVEVADERLVLDAVLQGLRSSSLAYDLAGAFWAAAGTLRIRRQEPILTERGKLMPLHLARLARPSRRSQVR
jgi:hypothetical protein